MAACSATRCSVTRCSATRASGTVGQDPIRTARPPEPPPQVPRALPTRAAAASSPVGKPLRETGQVAKRPRAAVPAVVRQPTGARAPAVTALVAASPVTVAPGDGGPGGEEEGGSFLDRLLALLGTAVTPASVTGAQMGAAAGSEAIGQATIGPSPSP